MKNIFESKETMEAYARIDYRSFIIKKICNEIPFIDLKDEKEFLVNLFEEQIEDKRFIEACVELEEEMLDKIKNVIYK